MKKFLKFFLAVIILATLAIGCFGCDKNSANSTNTNSPSGSTSEKDSESVSVVLSKTQLEMDVGDSYTLKAMVVPADITVVWSSSDEDVVTVNGGVLQAIAPGTSFIQAKAENATAVCTVEVKEVFGSISGTFTCKNYDTSKTGVDATTTIYLISENANDIDLSNIVMQRNFNRDDIYYATVDTLGNYKIDNIKVGQYRMIVVCGGSDFSLRPSTYPNAVEKVKTVLGDVYNRATDKNWIEEKYFLIYQPMLGFNVNVGKKPLTITKVVFGINTSSDAL